MGFIFGGNTGVKSPEELEQRRAIARQLMMKSAGQQPQNVWEGLGSLADAVGYRFAQNKLDEAETKQSGAASDRFKALFQPKDFTTPASYSPDEQTGAPGYRAIAKAPPRQNETGSWLNQQLRSDPDLKLTPAAAAGITGNLDLETGGFKHIQEIKPMIPGSRGGYGWAQWTGPRRVQFEAWAKQNGLDPASREANFGFLKHELMNTPEGKVLASLHGVEDPGQAATIFSDQFLRPGIPHNDRRVAAAQGYAGGSPNIQHAGDPQPVRLAQAGGPSLSEMLQVYADPWTSPEQKSVLQMYIEREMQASDPVRRQQLEKGELEIDALKNPKIEYGYETLPDGTLIRADKRGGIGAANINTGGSSDKQIFDALGESATTARAAVNGLAGIREARKAIAGGAITGAWANERLALQKVGAFLGVTDSDKIVNTETFRSAIAPQVAVMLNATLGSAQISSSDREFALQAADGLITLDERSITRLLDIMERAGDAAIEGHMNRLNKVYPDGKGFDRERAIFGVDMLAPEPPPQPNRRIRIDGNGRIVR